MAALGGGDKRKRKLDVGPSYEADKKLSSDSGDSKKATINPLTGRPYSESYYKILKVREGLPVYQFRDDFIKLVQANQAVILVGETGSGKTTRTPPPSLCQRPFSPFQSAHSLASL